MSTEAEQTPSAMEPDTGPSGSLQGWRRTARGVAPGAGIGIAVLVVTSLTVPDFATVTNLLNLLQQMAVVGVVAIGMTFVILTGGIDLSVGAVLELSGVLLAKMINSGMPVPLAMLIAIAAGAAVGLINGLGFRILGIAPFVMTLATLAIMEGLALTFANGTQITYTTNNGILNFLAAGGIGRLSGEFVVFAVLTLMAWFVLRMLPFGRYVYATGGNPETARLSGVRVGGVLVSVYVLAGACAALAGVMTTARLGVADPTAGSLTNLDAIAAVVIGGTALVGGVGSIWGTAIGSFVLAAISNVLTLKGVSPYASELIRGLIIIVAVLIGSWRILRARLMSRLGRA
jgi:ribose transport system permease protein